MVKMAVFRVFHEKVVKFMTFLTPFWTHFLTTLNLILTRYKCPEKSPFLEPLKITQNHRKPGNSHFFVSEPLLSQQGRDSFGSFENTF